MKFIPLFLFLAISGISSTILKAQPGAVDLTFNTFATNNNAIFDIAVQQDEKIIAVGAFSAFSGLSSKGVIRLKPNGPIDTSFILGTGANNHVKKVAVQPSGKIVISGLFTQFNGHSVGYIARLNSNGSVDTSFLSGTGFNNPVLSMAQYADGRLLVGGLFTSYNGFASNRIIRLLQNGEVDSTFTPYYGSNGSIEEIVLENNGNIIIGGEFTMYDSMPALRIARLQANGVKDASFSPTFGASGSVLSIIPSNGKYLIGGHFNEYEFQPREKIARILNNGQLDGQFKLGLGASDDVLDIVALPLNRTLVVGQFTSIDTNLVNRISVFDSLFNIVPTYLHGGANGYIAKAVTLNNKILIAGNFTNINGVGRYRIARLYNCLTPAPDSIYGHSFAFCNGTQQTYSVIPVPDAKRYEWLLPTGWIGTSDSATINIVSNGSGGNISVRAYTDSCGWSTTTTRTIRTIESISVPLCLVTVDSQSTHNIVLWEKQPSPLIDSFCVYRETTSNVYTKIATVPYNVLSEYHDTSANPNISSYRYKLSIIDTCGAESVLSPYHSTIHLQNLGNGNFQWTFYQIEGALNPVLSFNIYRDAFGTGAFFPIGNVPGTNATFTDISANSFPNALYLVDANWGISCEPSRAVNTTRSNIKHKGLIDVRPDDTTDVRSERILNELIKIFPNPAKNHITIAFPVNTTISDVALFNTYGQKMEVFTDRAGSNSMSLNLSGLVAGAYLLTLQTTNGTLRCTVIKE